MNNDTIRQAAQLLWDTWSRNQRLESLPPACRPETREDGYRIQHELARLSGQSVYGWKIAATSPAGQQHIGVDGPLAGRLLAGRVIGTDQAIALAGNIMLVAEAEFAFRMGRDMPARDEPYTVAEVMASVESMMPAIEIPDSRYRDFAAVGAAQLIADNACACWFIPGNPAPEEWRNADLRTHAVIARRNDDVAGEGKGENVLGDPRVALAWLANETARHGGGLRAGQVVTTGTCLVPVRIDPGDRLLADFGRFGKVEAQFV